MVVCGGALVIGAVASIAIPFAPFAAFLILAIGIGAGWAAASGMGAAQVLLSALALLVSSQVGYGLGLIAPAALEGARSSRRPTVEKPTSPALPDLNLGEKP